MFSAPSDIRFVNEIEDSAVADIEVRVAAFGAKVEGIPRKIRVSLGWLQRVVGVADCMRKSVGQLELKSMSQSLLKIHLQTVVKGISDRFIEEGPKACAVARIESIVVWGSEEVRAQTRPG
jgi:hypothetical protein